MHVTFFPKGGTKSRILKSGASVRFPNNNRFGQVKWLKPMDFSCTVVQPDVGPSHPRSIYNLTSARSLQIFAIEFLK